MASPAARNRATAIIVPCAVVRNSVGKDSWVQTFIIDSKEKAIPKKPNMPPTIRIIVDIPKTAGSRYIIRSAAAPI